MKFYNYLFPFIISCFFVSGSFAATEEKPYGPTGKDYTAHFGQLFASRSSEAHKECVGTPNGFCGDGTTCIEGSNNFCASCEKYYEGEYPYSDKYAFSYDACYKFCAPTSIPNGQIEPEFLTAYNPNDCKDKYVYCNNEMDKCNGYHAEGDTCVPNMHERFDETTGESGWEQWNGTGWVKYTTGCGSDSHLEPNATNADTNSPEWAYIMCTANTSSDIAHGKCVSNNRNCSDYFGTSCKNNDKGGTVGGEAKWIRADSLPEDADWVTSEWEDSFNIAGGYWDFSNCYCEIKDVDTVAGTATQHCFWGGSGPWGEGVVWSGGCETESFTECKAGNCDIDNSGICKQAPAGYFGDGTKMACQPCPIGATSAVGATGIDRCFMRGDSNSPTRFCDSVGCFNLKQNIPY